MWNWSQKILNTHVSFSLRWPSLRHTCFILHNILIPVSSSSYMNVVWFQSENNFYPWLLTTRHIPLWKRSFPLMAKHCMKMQKNKQTRFCMQLNMGHLKHSKGIQCSKGTYSCKKCNSDKSQPLKVCRNGIFRKNPRWLPSSLTYFSQTHLVYLEWSLATYELFPGSHSPSKWPEIAFSEKSKMAAKSHDLLSDTSKWLRMTTGIICVWLKFKYSLLCCK